MSDDKKADTNGAEKTAPKLVNTTCPGCQRHFRYDANDEPAYLPFCCDRCQWVDLGKWLKGEYLVSRSLLRDNDEQDD